MSVPLSYTSVYTPAPSHLCRHVPAHTSTHRSMRQSAYLGQQYLGQHNLGQHDLGQHYLGRTLHRRIASKAASHVSKPVNASVLHTDHVSTPTRVSTHLCLHIPTHRSTRAPRKDSCIHVLQLSHTHMPTCSSTHICASRRVGLHRNCLVRPTLLVPTPLGPAPTWTNTA